MMDGWADGQTHRYCISSSRPRPEELKNVKRKIITGKLKNCSTLAKTLLGLDNGHILDVFVNLARVI